MRINLNQKSWHANLYSQLYNDTLPNNLCKYFWRVIFALITLPAWCIICKIDKNIDAFNKVFIGGWLTTIFYFLGWSLSNAFCMSIQTDVLWIYYLTPLFAILTPIVAFGLLFGMTGLFIMAQNHLGRKLFKNETKSLFAAKVYAAKNKICPKIDWE